MLLLGCVALDSSFDLVDLYFFDGNSREVVAYLRELLQDEKKRILCRTISYPTRPLINDGDYFHHQFSPSFLSHFL